MSIYAGNGTINIPAYEVGEVKNGQIISFGNDKNRIKKEITSKEQALLSEKQSYEKQKLALMEAVKIENNPDLIKKIGTIDKIISRYTAHITDSKKKADMEQAIRKVFETENHIQIKEELSRIIRYPVTDDDAVYIISLQSRKRRVLESLDRIGRELQGKKTEEYPTLSMSDYGNLLSMSKNIKDAVTRYNESIQSIQKTEVALK